VPETLGFGLVVDVVAVRPIGIEGEEEGAILGIPAAGTPAARGAGT